MSVAALIGSLVVLGAPDSPYLPGRGERLTIDLGMVHTISQVTILPRQLAHGYGPADFRVLVSVDGRNFRTVGTFDKPAGQQADTFAIDPVPARYVRLWVVASWERAPDGNNVQIAEVSVSGPEGVDLARGVGIRSDTEEGRHPVSHANDGDPQTFWASAGQVVNQPVWELRPTDVWPAGPCSSSGLLPGLHSEFVDPGNTYRPKMVWFFNSMPDRESTTRQLEEMKAARLAGPAVFAYKGLEVPYLSAEWLDAVDWAARECRRVGLDIWILDEGSYPSGFADGKVTDDYPQFRSKALRVAAEQAVADGELFSWQAGAEPVVGILAARPEGAAGPETLDLTDLLRDGRVGWTCERGPWVVRVFIQRLESYACRSVSGGGRKDNTHSLPDYLRSDATARFIDVTHEAYEASFGDLFGTTVKGFFGDEPCLPHLPWTDAFLAEFLARKGYDLRPHLPALVGAPDAGRDGILYDYYDVLASLWAEGFYKPQDDWCREHGLTYTAHLCGEEDMMGLIHNLDADFFGSLMNVSEPGVDVIWRQIYYGCATDFPKLAGSAADVWGKQRAMSESFAVFGSGTTYEQMKFVTDYQLARGVNDLFIMQWCYSPDGWRRLMHPPDFSPDSPLYRYLGAYADYTARGSLVASEGVPIADIAVYYPTRAGWTGDGAALDSAHAIGRMLLEDQRGSEWIDDNGLADCCAPEPGGMRNRSGTLHRVLVIPSTPVIGERAAERVVQFVRAGGTAVFVDRLPTRIGGLRQPESPLRALLSRLVTHGEWVAEGDGRATVVSSVDALRELLGTALPRRVEVAPACPALRLSGHTVGECDVWLVTSESAEPVGAALRFPGRSAVEQWDLESGSCRALPVGDGTVALRLPPYGSTVLVTRPEGEAVATQADDSFTEVATLDGDWDWTFVGADGATHRGPLELWADIGRPEYSGDVVYEKALNLPTVPEGRLVMDLGLVKYACELTVNGTPVGSRLWPPYAFEVTGLLKTGDNQLRIVVTNTPANRFFARPENRAAAEAQGWFDGTYVGTYERFEADSLPSGLLGPVRVLSAP